MVARREASLNKLVVLVGETASGKSKLSLEIAKKYTGEILCADSWTVRKSMNIGTAKPSAAEQKAVPHHLLDIVEPDEPFTAADFKRLAIKTIHDIQTRHNLSILVGGTGLYVDAVCYDFSFLPGENSNERELLNTTSIEDLLVIAQQRGIDLTNVDLRNKRRIIRAIESEGQKPSRSELRSNTLILGIKIPSEELPQRIEARVDAMLAAGLKQEVKELARHYGWETEGMKGIGYREWREYFEGTQTLEQTRERIIAATKNLAKRQRTWFKRNADIQWVDSSAAAMQLVAGFVAS